MVQRYLLLLSFLSASCFLDNVSSRPSNNDDSTQYLPFYGGAKGQYLEIRKDTRGSVLSERIVPEESISNENIFKATEGNLQAKIFQANLAELKSLSSSVLRLYNLGRRLGYLGEREKERFETQLASLEETASNTVKIIDEIGDDVNVLFKKNKPESTTSSTTAAAEHSSSVPALRRYQDNYDDDDVGEEGISVGAQADDEHDEVHERGTISEAKPIGLAVVGENGLAASRPIATAVAASGVAIARPIATAIAGLDPTLLGIDFQLNHQRKSFKINKKT
ncbi:uncharacterized protein LOC110991757 isoform X2 [Pieris rapae]|uniref:uncharacterized protein LOC110991757 isoform X2 n=1 Tax=Pieris rapae TaxID=64459 RepID=UPI001E28155E|nr:uncharacterized protein LOC110991757 isoform X2 [Pieris rapae]